MRRLAVPRGPGLVALAAATTAWIGADAAQRWGWAVLAAAALAAVAAYRYLPGPATALVAVAFAAAALSGVLAAGRRAGTLTAALPEGRTMIAGRAHTDPQPFGREHRFLLSPTHLQAGDRWLPFDGPRLAVAVDRDVEVAAGQQVSVAGVARADPHLRRGDPVAGTITAARVTVVAEPADPLFRIGNLLRARVEAGIARHRPDPAAALLSGFLIGDVRDVPATDHEALRRAGLTHFVAVSGSNVALFLAAWWLATGPLAVDPRMRAAIGLVGLAVFVVVTRWEPSVVRAATMAGLVLGGRLVAVPLDAWTSLGAAVALLLVVSAELTADPGFQLSVAATAGVIAGAGVFRGRRPRWAWAALGATASAQLAVAPLLLLHFGTVPMLAPLANMFAAPLVAVATSLGGLGVVTGVGPLTQGGVLAARAVLEIARVAAGWPQLGAVGVAVGLATLGLAVVPRLRPMVAVVAAIALAAAVALPVGPPAVPTAVFLDVGQGDAALLLGRHGETILIDGGPNAALLAAGLRRHGVDRIDLMVVSHGHADHVTGLLGVLGSISVGRLWHSGRADPGMAGDLLSAAAEQGIPADAIEPGWTAHIGEFIVEVLGPVRRYASPNDESVVLRVTSAGRTVLFPGDIEAIAQSDLGPLRADVLKVPHQGAATSDLEWLHASAGRLAVISVGPNTFGHPSDDVVATLRQAGAEVRRTDEEGDIVVRLS